MIENIILNDLLILKSLLMIIIFFFIYEILDNLKIFSSTLIKTILSLSTLGIIYFSLPNEFIFSITSIYENITLTIFLTIITFSILLFITINSKKQLFGRLLWLFLSIFFWTIFFYKGIRFNPFQINQEGILFLISAIGFTAITIFLPEIRKFFLFGEIKELEEETKNQIKGFSIASKELTESIAEQGD